MREIDFFKDQPKKVEVQKKEKPKPKMDDMFADMMGGDSSDDVDLMEFDAPPKPKAKP